ncbi:acyl-CoA dehydrogenase family protein [Pararhodobacter zhoushanensis]|uniref:Acyl-CoA dehydrogenase family protein n=1 Tax=Pararhodobacter zhoushanensis TaxID=2479545 RepID=A0ABT3H176_9RHOB|nr:acyl-CoA dehydrogenase family protein [Pararhodobacter zhoushanensis]MCW1933575.1 acyl-CoA dehydrogenase family protein [Pararhodobacter zhoushanensis]
MELTFNSEQIMLADSVDRYGLDKWPAINRHKLLAGAQDGFRTRWREMAELGWTLLPITEEDGGLGGSAVDVMALAEGLGRHLIAVPYVTSCISVPALIGGVPGGEDLLGALGEGKAFAAAGVLEAEGGGDPAWVTTRAEKVGGAWQLTGMKEQVEDGGCADAFVVSARVAGEAGDADGIGLFLVDRAALGDGVARFRAVDGHLHARLTLQGTPALALGEPGQALPRITAALDRAICAHLAEATGSMEAASAATVAYLKTREQFGQPIGSFQALQHRAADMTVACEEARAITWHATLALDAAPGSRQRAVSAGKVRVGQSGVYVGQQAVQLHGGVGFCEELIVSHHLRRQMMLDMAMGGQGHHLSRVAQLSV